MADVPLITTPSPDQAVRQWFELLGRYCAAVDFESARAIFAEDVASFGTLARVVTGVEAVESEQWRGIWPNIADFKIDMETVASGGDGDLAWGMAAWSSTGFHEDGSKFDRLGRATVVLQRRDGQWLAVHTHFSLVPGTPPGSFGPINR